MNILLIAPASGPWRGIGQARVFNGRTFRFSLLSLLSVAAETPPRHRLHIVDEQVDEIPWESRFDVVGITCMTALAPRAYELADRFRRQGTRVVLGGMHPTFCPEEALGHADAVVAGEAEGVWTEVLVDLERGRSRGIYRAVEPVDLERLKRPPRHLLNPRHYSTLQAVQATRGCPNRCRFCSIAAASHGTQRRRSVESVAREVADLPGRFFMFVDDNLPADPDYASALFAALRPLGRHWVMQSTLAIADDERLVRAAADAGCVGVFTGLETFRAGTLAAVQKECHRAHEYRERIALLHRCGIQVEAGIVFGFDSDDAATFQATLAWLDDLQVDAIQVSVFSPLPGTPQYEALQDRIFERHWDRYDFHHVVFEPQRMSAEALQAGHDWITAEFYRPGRIAARLARVARRPRGVRALPYAAAINLAYLGRVRRWHIQGWNPAAEKKRYRAAYPFATAIRQPAPGTTAPCG